MLFLRSFGRPQARLAAVPALVEPVGAAAAEPLPGSPLGVASSLSISVRLSCACALSRYRPTSLGPNADARTPRKVRPRDALSSLPFADPVAPLAPPDVCRPHRPHQYILLLAPGCCTLSVCHGRSSSRLLVPRAQRAGALREAGSISSRSRSSPERPRECSRSAREAYEPSLSREARNLMRTGATHLERPSGPDTASSHTLHSLHTLASSLRTDVRLPRWPQACPIAFSSSCASSSPRSPSAHESPPS